MNMTDKKIGIWGLGVMGRSALTYFQTHGAQLEVIDTKELPEQEQQALSHQGIAYYRQQNDLAAFLERNDFIVPSSGINLKPFKAFEHKWLAELEYFFQHWRKPIIAITGTIGKTSTTHILGQLVQTAGLRYTIGGNIGVGLFDLLQDKDARGAVIELSSFQLELSTTFAPDLAIWTNFFPNHLDRHASEQEYFDAKFKIMSNQQPHQQALLPLQFLPIVRSTHPVHSQLSFFVDGRPTSNELAALHSTENLFFIDEQAIKQFRHGTTTTLIRLDQLPAISFAQNWLIICSALHLLAIPLSIIKQKCNDISVPQHRLEKITTFNGVDFYNDSKSSTVEATLAAVRRLQGRPIHLFLGGLSKGVDKTPLIANLVGKVGHIYCFGKEAAMLSGLCQQFGIPHSMHASLEDAFGLCKNQIITGDQVLLSPAGASFDLFANYIERGNRFKELVGMLTTLK